MFKTKLCIKQKSIVFILLLISILLLTLYFQNRISNKNYLIQISKNYKKNFDNYYEFFKKHLIDFYDVQTIYIQNNPNTINQLVNKEKFLEDVKIVNFKKEKITTVYSEEIKKGRNISRNTEYITYI